MKKKKNEGELGYAISKGKKYSFNIWEDMERRGIEERRERDNNSQWGAGKEDKCEEEKKKNRKRERGVRVKKREQEKW